MKIDIIINNILGIINSKFLNVYAGVRWVKNLGILVKKWGKGVRLIDKNAFSSYAMILMLIHYLIKVKAVKPILDARNRSKDSPHFRFKRLKATD
jgi:DNA polymerase sigma